MAKITMPRRRAVRKKYSMTETKQIPKFVDPDKATRLELVEWLVAFRQTHGYKEYDLRVHYFVREEKSIRKEYRQIIQELKREQRNKARIENR